MGRLQFDEGLGRFMFFEFRIAPIKAENPGGMVLGGFGFRFLQACQGSLGGFCFVGGFSEFGDAFDR